MHVLAFSLQLYLFFPTHCGLTCSVLPFYYAHSFFPRTFLRGFMAKKEVR